MSGESSFIAPSDVLSERKRRFKTLVRMCKGGANRTAAVKDDRLIKAKSDREFCAECAANICENDFLIKLLSLQERFAKECPEAPKDGEEATKHYLAQCASLLRKWASEIDSSEAYEIAENSVASYATEFSVKLIHSGAEGCSIVADRYETSLTHISSRSMRKAGHEVLLDQLSNDSTGVYQRVNRVISDDPIAKESGLSDEVIAAMKAGAIKGLEIANSQEIKRVDQRLRQLLVPSGDGYISISPVASAGLNAVIGKRVSEWELLQPPKKPKKGKKEKTEHLSRIDLEIGGSNSQNVTTLGSKEFYFAKPLYFYAPQRSMDVQDVWSFIHRRWVPYISNNDAIAVADQLAQLQKDKRVAEYASISAIDAQAVGDIKKLTRICDKQARDIAEKIATTQFHESGVEVEISKALIEGKRSEPIGTLDQCLLDQNFGAEYRESLARAITSELHAKLYAINRNELNAEVDRLRTSGAIEKILSERTA